jgi:hypothetical protein
MTKKLETHVRLHIKTGDPRALQEPESFANFCMELGRSHLKKRRTSPKM